MINRQSKLESGERSMCQASGLPGVPRWGRALAGSTSVVCGGRETMDGAGPFVAPPFIDQLFLPDEPAPGLAQPKLARPAKPIDTEKRPSPAIDWWRPRFRLPGAAEHLLELPGPRQSRTWSSWIAVKDIVRKGRLAVGVAIQSLPAGGTCGLRCALASP